MCVYIYIYIERDMCIYDPAFGAPPPPPPPPPPRVRGAARYLTPPPPHAVMISKVFSSEFASVTPRPHVVRAQGSLQPY